MILASARAALARPGQGSRSGVSASVWYCSGTSINCTVGASANRDATSPLALASGRSRTPTPKVFSADNTIFFIRSLPFNVNRVWPLVWVDSRTSGGWPHTV